MASRLMRPIRWLLADPSPERRSLDPMTAWLRDDTSSPTTHAGVRVTQDNALGINALHAAVSLIADTISMLPRRNYVEAGEFRQPAPMRHAWMDSPDPDGLTWFHFSQQWLISKMISHGACVRVLRDGNGDTLALKVLDPRRVNPTRDSRGQVVYDYDGRYVIDARDMLYDPMLLRPGQVKGVSKVDELRETFGIGKALDEYTARFFGSGSNTSGVLEFPNEVTPAQAKEIQDAWEAGHRGLRNSHRPGIVYGGGHYTKTSVDPEEAQMLGSREFSVEEACRAYRIHPSMLQMTKPGTNAYASREQDAIQYTTFTVMSYITPMEQLLDRLLPGREFMKITVDALLRASLADRYAAYNQGVQGGFLTINRINQLEDLPPVEGGDAYRVPLANIDLAAANVAELQKRVEMFVALVGEGADPTSAASVVGLPAVAFSPQITA